MALQVALVQCLDDDDRQFAEEVLGRNGPVQATPARVRGYADEADVRALEERGLVVERLPEIPTLSWLEPAAQQAPPREMLEAGAMRGLASPIQEAAAAAPKVYLIQFQGPLLPEWRSHLEERGIKLLRHVPDFAFTAALTEKQREEVGELPYVVRAPEYTPAMTLRRMAGGVAPAARSRSLAPELRTWELRCHDPGDLPEVARAMERDRRITSVQVIGNKIRFQCPEDPGLLGELGAMPQVSMVDEYRVAELCDAFVRAAIGVEAGNPPQTLPWDGTGMIVGVADSGVDAEHPDLKSRLAGPVLSVGDSHPLDDANGHGTHVCGIIAGIAPGARLLVQSLDMRGSELIGLPDNLAELFQAMYDAGVRIHNDSWGFRINNGAANWTADSAEVEDFIYRHPDFLVVFAAGNEGAQPSRLEPGDAVGLVTEKSLRSPSTAKNALAVGACGSPRTDGPFENKRWGDYAPNRFRYPLVSQEPVCGDPDCLAGFSSRGPVDDRRVKPDIVAPGTVILSARSAASQPDYPFPDASGRYAFMNGTSMAAPVVSGAAAIVRQYYQQERGHAAPSAALLKATLINGALPITRPTAGQGRPNSHQGFGRLDLRAALPLPGNPDGFRLLFADIDRSSEEALRDSDSRHAVWRRVVRVAAGLPLRITLAWTDMPQKGLQQDLDLVLQMPDGTRVLGNPDWPRPDPAHKTDHTNNVEQILLPDPAPGDYRINVVAYSTPFEKQGFSLAVTGRLQSDLLP